MAAALSHVTYIGGIKHVKKPHPYHFSKKKEKEKKSGLKGILCVAYCWLEVKFNFWREAAACTKLCQSPPKNGALFRCIILTFTLGQEGIKLGDPGCEH